MKGAGQQEDDAGLAKYALPPHIFKQVENVSWDVVIDLSTSYSAEIKHKSPKLKKIEKELNMTRLLLMESIREQEKEGRIDPKLLVDLVNLLQKCERMAQEYEIDLKKFNSFLYLLIEKVKKHKMARHEGPKLNTYKKISPLSEKTLEYFKVKSERKGKKGKKKRK
ncbi:MAG: hypothetical protein ABIH83_02735 [Candidatus Micrarchaeota archaeon]